MISVPRPAASARRATHGSGRKYTMEIAFPRGRKEVRKVEKGANPGRKTAISRNPIVRFA